MQIPNKVDDVNVRAPRFLLARTMAACRRCAHPTPLLGLALPPGHMVLELDDEAEDDGRAIDTWRIAHAAAFIFYVEFITDSVQSRLARCTRSFRPRDGGGRSEGDGRSERDVGPGSYWANHCERCGTAIDDHELYCEPEGAFLPLNEEGASLIQLVPIDEPLEAVAGGYAHEPAHFRAMR